MWCEYQANEMVVNRNNINQIKEIICIFCNELVHELNTCKQCVYQANELVVYQNNKTKYMHIPMLTVKLVVTLIIII